MASTNTSENVPKNGLEQKLIMFRSTPKLWTFSCPVAWIPASLVDEAENGWYPIYVLDVIELHARNVRDSITD
jgi:hypothetical protein